MEETNLSLKLYQKVAIRGGGIVRISNKSEADDDDQQYFSVKQPGLQLVIVARAHDGKILAELYCFKPSDQAVAHILTDLSMVIVHGVEKKKLTAIIFEQLLTHVENNCPDILRVEVLVAEADTAALTLYKKWGFQVEGRFEKRIRKKGGHFEATIPMAWFNAKFKA